MPEVPARSGSAFSQAGSPADSLADEQQAARILLDLLSQEQALLISADIDSLALITERKSPVVSLMSELATRRHRALTAAGHAASEAGMKDWLASRSNGKPAHPVAAQAYGALLAMARQAQEINRINGLLINTHMTRNQSALNVLRVQTTGGNFYGPDGQAAPRGMGRGLVVG